MSPNNHRTELNFNDRGIISFVIPVMNEQETLVELYQGISKNVPEGSDFEVIFVDDGSLDNSWNVIVSLADADPQRVRGIRFRSNRGKAAALTAGFKAANGSLLFTMDADLQDDPKEIPRFIEKLNQGYGLVSGWKRVRHDPWHKVLPSRIFNRMLSSFTGVNLHDHNCGFKCYQGSLAKHLVLHGELHRMVPSLAAIHGYRVAEIVVTHHPRKYGVSKYGAERFVRGFSDMLTMGFQRRFRERPSHCINHVGIFYFALAVVLAVAGIANGITQAIGVAYLMTAAILAAFGVSTLVAGQMAELIIRGGLTGTWNLPIVEDTAVMKAYRSGAKSASRTAHEEGEAASSPDEPAVTAA